MPLIPPQFINNPSASPTAASASAPFNKPPWARGPVANNQQATDNVPWRRNLRSVSRATSSDSASHVASPAPVAGPPQSPFATSTLLPQQPLFQNQQPQPQVQLQQPKTSRLQISLKSVKKPETPPITPSASTSTCGEGIPIPIFIQKTVPPSQPQAPQNPPELQRPSTFQVQQPASVVGPPPPPPLQRMPQASSGGGPPPAPPPPPMAPPPPPPLPEEMTAKQLKLEQLRKGIKKRPDWGGMMREIEKNKVLKKVECNDRSKPILSRLKSRGRFIYESEKPASKSDALHDKILDQIQKGVKLKKVHCNDRSKPILIGLRVRRQGSVLEGEGLDATAVPLDTTDDLAFLDIDVLRDELQSAKQLLAAEIDSKHSMERKTRDQKCQIITMEAEIESLKAKLGIIPEGEVSLLTKNLEKSDSKTFKHLRKSGSSLWKSPSSAGLKKSKSGLSKSGTSDANLFNRSESVVEEDLTEMNEMEEEIVSLKEAVQHARQLAEEIEEKYKEAMAKLQEVQDTYEDSEQKRKSAELQLEGMLAQQEGKAPLRPIVPTAERTTQTEEQIFERTTSGVYSRQQSQMDEASESENEDDSDVEVDEEGVQKKNQERELKLWENKVKSVKDKQHTSRTERKNLKNLQKKLEEELKEANKRHKKLQKEVDKMAKMLKDAEKELLEDDEDAEEAEEEEEKEAEEEEEEEETEEEETEEEESESEDDDDDADNSSEEDDEKASYDDRLAVFNKRVKRRENVLNALRKGNYLLRANIDRLKDDLEDARIAYHDLEHELKSVLEECEQ